MANCIPILDISELVNPNEENYDRESYRKLAKDFREKFHEIGFLYIINHGIPQNMIDEALTEANNFFTSPTQIKRKYLKSKDGTYHGYSEPGQEMLDIENRTYEFKEAFDLFGEDRIYPDEEFPNFGVALPALEKKFKEFARKIFRLMGTVLDLEDEGSLSNLANGFIDSEIVNFSLLRAIYYPPIPKDENWAKGKDVVRCGVHSDYGILTLLLQDPIGGLEVKNKDGQWVTATPIPGSLLINIGQTLEIISGGYFPATLHRVPIPDCEIQRNNPRTSIGLFTYPDKGTILQPLKKKDGTLLGDYEPFDPIKRGLEIATQTYKY